MMNIYVYIYHGLSIVHNNLFKNKLFESSWMKNQVYKNILRIHVMLWV
jgi:hypothetical protein